MRRSNPYWSAVAAHLLESMWIYAVPDLKVALVSQEKFALILALEGEDWIVSRGLLTRDYLMLGDEGDDPRLWRVEDGARINHWIERRWRLAKEFVCGVESNALTVPLFAQSWNGKGFQGALAAELAREEKRELEETRSPPQATESGGRL